MQVGLLPCSGACNVGFLTTKAVVNVLGKKDNTGFVCALGLPLGIKGIIDNAKKSERYVAVNGCPVKCATKALESVGIDVDKEVVVTHDFNCEKSKDFSDEKGLARLTEKLIELVDEF